MSPRNSAPQSASLPARTRQIAPAQDRQQSRAVVAITLSILLPLLCFRTFATSPYTVLPYLLTSALFAALALGLRSATAPAAAAGGLLCLAICFSPQSLFAPRLPAGLLAMIALFVLTTLATRFGRARKQRLGLAEPRHGRRTSQVCANLGVAALFAACGFYPGAVAALAEATADTVSSEVGQALGGPTWMISTLQPVAPGTDGGISLRGTIAGISAALLVCLAGAPSGSIAALVCSTGLLAGVAGLLFDSLLGATLERRGLLGNDVVNLVSTLFSAALASGIWFLLPHTPYTR